MQHILLTFLLGTGTLTTINTLPSQAQIPASTTLPRLLENLLNLFQSHTRDDRVITPLLKTFDLLLSNELVGADVKYTYDAADQGKTSGDGDGDAAAAQQGPTTAPQALLSAVATEVRACKQIPKIMAGGKVVIASMQFSGDVRHRALGQALRLLGHRYPKVRKATSEWLYVRLLAFDDILPSDEAEADEILSILTETSWESPDSMMVRGARDSIFRLFGRDDIPVVIQRQNPANGGSRPKAADEMESYASLVKEVGF